MVQLIVAPLVVIPEAETALMTGAVVSDPGGGVGVGAGAGVGVGVGSGAATFKVTMTVLLGSPLDESTIGQL